MTRPLYEPSAPRTDAYLDFQQQQLFRRPAPSGSETNVFSQMDMGDIGSITSGVWTSVVVNNDYDEADTSDPDDFAAFAPDVSSGCIKAGNGGYYIAMGWARPNDTYTAGKSLGVAIDHGNNCVFASFRVANQVNADGIIEDDRICVCAPFLNPAGVVGPDSVRLLVYHNEGASMDWGDCRLALIYITGPAITILP